MSDDVGVLSNCCFDGSQPVLAKSSFGVLSTTFKELYDMPSKYKRNFTIFHNGSWVKGKIVRLPARQKYLIKTANNKSIIVTDNHINPTLNGDKDTLSLTTNDYLLFNTRALNTFKEKDLHLTYAQGFLIGMYLGDGSRHKSETSDSVTVELSINAKKYENSIDILKESLKDLDENEFEFRLNTPCNNMYPLRIHSKKVYNFIKTWVHGGKANTKELDDNVLLQSKDFRRGILDGHYLTDGGNSNRIYSTSEKLINNIEMLITSLGLNSVINVSDRTNEKVCIRDEEFNRNFPVYCIRWYNGGNRRTEKDVYVWKNNSVYFKITSIEPYKSDDEYVYCFEMENQNEPYFTLPNGIVTHNCRLLSDTSKLSAFVNSIGGTALSIGSVAVNTINLVRIAYEAKGDEGKYLEILKDRTLLCCKTLDIVRHIIKRNIEKGLLPNYQEGGVELEKQYSTVGY